MAARNARVLMRTFVIAGVVALTGGCYQPSLKDCTVSCEAPTDCADGQQCRAGFCVADGIEDCTPPVSVMDGAALDARRSDAPPRPDAPAPTCSPQACTNGTCVDGVCVIDCTADGSCTQDVKCPENVACRVECGPRACSKKIICDHATSCTVVCAGEASCRDEIVCNENACDVTCSGLGSCGKKTKCEASCSCDVRCTGPLSCNDPSECPGDTCRAGEGCSSNPAGCDTCM